MDKDLRMWWGGVRLFDVKRTPGPGGPPIQQKLVCRHANVLTLNFCAFGVTDALVLTADLPIEPF